MNELVIVRGGGDIATGVISKLHNAGFKVLVLEVERPTCIRRKVAFSEAVYEGNAIVEGIESLLVKSLDEIDRVFDLDKIPVYIDPKGESFEILEPFAIVDSTISKRNLGMSIGMAPVVIGVGPGYEAGVDADYVIESSRSHNLGRVIKRGYAKKNTGIPGVVLGHREDRVIRGPKEGIMKNIASIGDMVEVGDPLCEIGGQIVTAKIPGVVRGLLREGLPVHKGMKIGDVDPRFIIENAYTISDKARAIGGAVLEMVLYSIKNKKVK